MLFAVVPAAGSGSRMGGGLPKQYLALAGKTVLDHSLQALLDYPELEHLVVALAADDVQWAASSHAGHPCVTTAQGGTSRAESVLAGLQALQSQASDDDHVLVHDAARPCLRAEDLDKLVRQGRRSADGALLAVPARDTLKQADNGVVSGTLDRRQIWQAQTPQLFRFGHLFAALQQAGADVTDEASAIEAQGGHPRLVQGHHDNIKITYLEDLALAEAALRNQGRIE